MLAGYSLFLNLIIDNHYSIKISLSRQLTILRWCLWLSNAVNRATFFDMGDYE